MIIDTCVGTDGIAEHLQPAVNAILRLQRQLCHVTRFIPEVPRGDIFRIAVGGICRTFYQYGGAGTFLIERRTALFILTEDESVGTRHDIIALGAAHYGPYQFVSRQRRLYQRYANRSRIINSLYPYRRRDDQRVVVGVFYVLRKCRKRDVLQYGIAVVYAEETSGSKATSTRRERQTARHIFGTNHLFAHYVPFYIQ